MCSCKYFDVFGRIYVDLFTNMIYIHTNRGSGVHGTPTSCKVFYYISLATYLEVYSGECAQRAKMINNK